MINGIVALIQAGLLKHQSVLETHSGKPALGTTSEPAPMDRTELFTHLHILAGLQERDCRISGLELSQSPETVRAYVAAWLYGAACALCGPSQQHSDALAGLVAQITSRKTGIRQAEAVQTIATLTSCETLLACFRAGLEGAEHWHRYRYVQPESSLYAAITANALI